MNKTKDLILAIDQGTTGTTALLIDSAFHILAKKTVEFSQHYPQAGWVEHDPEEIWQSVLKAIRCVVKQPFATKIAAIGITNQRETTLIWERNPPQNSQNSFKSIGPAIVWQDKRTEALCANLKKRGLEAEIREKTGLLIDPYFSATKIRWLLDHLPEAKTKAKKEKLAFGTIETFLLWRMTNGKVHATDVSNASRTLLMNLESLDWDSDLLKLFKIPRSILPKIVSCSEIYGKTNGVAGLPDGIPIAGMAGDQQAALFGQACFEPGMAKCTYGTGSFILMNTGSKIVRSKKGLLTTVAWKIGNKTCYALEGSAFIAGAAVTWLRDGLQIIKNAKEVEKLAKSVPDSGGVVFLPALSGLGAPYWKPELRGQIYGLTRGSTKAHLARATLEGIAFLQHDILEVMQNELRKKLKILRVDGGAAANNLLMQFQADILKTRLSRPESIETTALGAAFLAGLAVGVWKSEKELNRVWKEARVFQPQMPQSTINAHLKRWKQAFAVLC